MPWYLTEGGPLTISTLFSSCIYEIPPPPRAHPQVNEDTITRRNQACPTTPVLLCQEKLASYYNEPHCYTCAQYHGSAYRKPKIGAYGSREFLLYCSFYSMPSYCTILIVSTHLPCSEKSNFNYCYATYLSTFTSVYGCAGNVSVDSQLRGISTRTKKQIPEMRLA